MARKKSPSIAQRSYGCLLGSMSRFVRLLPAGIADQLGVFIGFLMRTLLGKQRKRALANLKMCFPEWSDLKIKSTTKAVFQHFGKTGIRFLRGTKLSAQQIIANTEINGFEEFEKALQLGKGAIYISAHFGNWEHNAQYLTARLVPLDIVVRDANEESVSEIVNDVRRSKGIGVIPRGDAARHVVKTLRQNHVVGILPDQNTYANFIPFFGFPAGTAIGPAVFHLKLGSPMLFGYCRELANGKYRIEVKRLELPTLEGTREQNAIRIMEIINAEIEALIRLYPEQWLWIHDRWKSARLAGMLQEGQA